MSFSGPLIHALLGFAYMALALASLQSLWPLLPNPPLLWCLLPALVAGLAVAGLSRALRGKQLRKPTPLEWVLIGNAALLWAFIALQELPGVPPTPH